jgi:hypothetical protein
MVCLVLGTGCFTFGNNIATYCELIHAATFSTHHHLSVQPISNHISKQHYEKMEMHNLPGSFHVISNNAINNVTTKFMTYIL